MAAATLRGRGGDAKSAAHKPAGAADRTAGAARRTATPVPGPMTHRPTPQVAALILAGAQPAQRVHASGPHPAASHGAGVRVAPVAAVAPVNGAHAAAPQRAPTPEHASSVPAPAPSAAAAGAGSHVANAALPGVAAAALADRAAMATRGAASAVAAATATVPAKAPATAAATTGAAPGVAEVASPATADAPVAAAAALPAATPATAGPAAARPAPAAAAEDGAAALVPAVSAAGPASANTAVALLMPEPPAALTPRAAARVQGVQARAGGAAAAHGSLPAGAQQAAGARAAVAEPDAEAQAKAQQTLIALVHAAPSPEIVSLGHRIKALIASKRPPDEAALMAAEPEGAALNAGSQLNAAIDGETQKAAANYGPVNQPADAQGQPGAELRPQPAVAATPALNATAGVPDAVAAANVSLDQDAALSKRRAQDAGMDTPAAQLVQNGPVAETRQAQAELEQTAKEDLAQVMAAQKEALGRAEADMAALQAQALAALTASRTGAEQGTVVRQQGMVGSEQAQRERAGAEAKKAFDDAKTQVDALLRPLAASAMAEWDAAKEVLAAQFKADLAPVQRRVDERHAGVDGYVVALWDVVTGLPAWAEEGYAKAEQNFGDAVVGKLESISTRVNAVIASCDLLIKTARERIAAIYAELPESLRTWAQGEQARFDGQLDHLHDEVMAVRDGFNKDLVARSSAAVDEVRAEIAALRKKAGGLIGRITDAIRRFADDPVKFIIEGLLELVGIPPASFWAVVAKIQKVVKDIAADPLGFANKLLQGLGDGFAKFFDTFGTHLLKGFLGWLLGGVKDVQIPKELSVRSIVTFFLELMGITWPNIRKILVKKIGAKNVALVEKVYSLVSLLMEKGPHGIYEMIKEKLDPQSIVDQVIDMAVDFMVSAIAKQVGARILLLFNPAGAIAQALEAIYRVLKWIFENAARIFTLIETVVNGIADILAGNTAAFAAAVDKALGMLIAPVIGFIADYMSMGDLPSIVAAKIKSMREWILGLIESALTWIIEKGKALLAAMGIGKKEKDKGGDSEVGESVSIDAPGESHTLYIEIHGNGAVLMVASSNPMPVPEKLKSFEARLSELPEGKTRQTAVSNIAQARKLAATTDKKADELVRAKHQDGSASSPAGNDDTAVVSDERALAEILKSLYTAFGELGVAPVAGRYGELRQRENTGDREAHHVPPKGVLKWLVKVANKARTDLSHPNNPFTKSLDINWIEQLAKVPEGTFDPGNSLAAISVDKHTHIKTTGDPAIDAWRIHWGSETAKAVFVKLAGRQILVEGQATPLNFVFIRRRLWHELNDADRADMLSMEKEAGAPIGGAEIGIAVNAAGLVISTQFFHTELDAALAEAQGTARVAVDKLLETLGEVARGAAAVSRAAVESALANSKRDGTEDEKAAALAALTELSAATWNAVPGVSNLRML